MRKGGKGLLIELVLLGADGRTVLAVGGGSCQLFSCLKPGICAWTFGYGLLLSCEVASDLIDIDLFRLVRACVAALLLLSVGVDDWVLLLAGFFGTGMGRDIPRSFPRLATPTPHVRTVL